MKCLLALAMVGVFAQHAKGDSASDLNVNSRYVVESIGFANPHQFHLSDWATEEIQHLTGQRLNLEALSRLVSGLTQELRARAVHFHLERGDEPAHVRVLLEVERRPTRTKLCDMCQ